ncbi:hypothetical protein ACF1BQ_026835 [Bradyrhizobium sp. RDT10]
MNPPGLLWLQADFWLDPARATFRCACYGKVDIACQATADNPPAQGSNAA